MVKRWIAAGLALAASAAVSVSVMVAGDPNRGSVEVLAAARDIPVGTAVDLDSIAFVRFGAAAPLPSLFTRRDEGAVAGLRATHDLAPGQLIQRTDVAPADASPDRRLVFIPVKDTPPVAPGARVDLMVITGGAGGPAVQPFALGVEVRDSTSSGLVVVVPANKAAAFVYAGSAMQLTAVIAEPGFTQGLEVPVSSDREAIDIAAAP